MTTLAVWLRSEHDLAERLELIDNLCRALEGFHARSPGVRPALDPTRVELTPALAVDLSPADPNEDGYQVPEYRAPEIVGGGRYTPTSGTFSAGLLCYEVLAGRHPYVMSTPLGTVEAPPDVPPTPLTEARPDVPRDLAEAIMPCLERDPEWRPKDLSYLAETLRKARETLPASGRRRAPVRAAPARPAPVKAMKPPPSPLAEREKHEVLPSLRAAPRRPAPGRLPVFAVAGAGLLIVLGGLWYVTQPAPRETAAPPPARAPNAGLASTPAPAGPVDIAATAGLGAKPPSEAPLSGTAAPPTTAPVVADTHAATPPPPPGPGLKPLREPAGAPSAPPPTAPTPAPREVPPTPAARVSAPTPAPIAEGTRAEPLRREAAPLEPARAQPASAPPPSEPAAPVRPAVVTALVPPRLRRGATVLVDVRGSDLRADLQPRILFKGRETPAGVQALGQRFVDSSLLKVMLKVDEQAREGSYTLALADARGNVSNARPFEVGR